MQMSEQVSSIHGAVEECPVDDQKAPGSTPGSFEVEDMPKLKHKDATPTPLKKPGGKRPAVELSQISESDFDDKLNNLKKTVDDAMQEAIKKAIPDAVQEAIRKAIPGLIASIKDELKDFIKATVDTSVKEMKNEIVQFVQAETDDIQAKNEAQILCEAELLETYNRRDNIKIFGVNEADASRQEPPEVTMQKVIDIAEVIQADVKDFDISIAHRLPAKGPTRPIIVKFARRVAKISMMKRKRELRGKEQGKELRIVEDVSRARATFIGMLKYDERINYVWTKEGSILYTIVNDDKVYKIGNLLHGAYDLGYSTDDVLYCFRNY